MNDGRSSASAVTYGGSVFAIGGYNGTDALGGVEQYNFEEGIWSGYTNLATPRYHGRCISTMVDIINTCGMVQVHRV